MRYLPLRSQDIKEDVRNALWDSAIVGLASLCFLSQTPTGSQIIQDIHKKVFPYSIQLENTTGNVDYRVDYH